MEIRSVGQIEDERIGEIRLIPFTFFQLDSSDKRRYNDFRSARDSLEDAIKKTPLREKEEEMRRINNLFSEFITPYLESCGLEALNSFTYWGNSKRVCVVTPHYNLFKKEEPFDACLEVNYWFLTRDENLRCSSYLNLAKPRSFEKRVIYNLLNYTIVEESNDGIKHPLLSLEGDFMYFASTGFSKPLMFLIREILIKIGPQTMEELSVLYKESLMGINSKDISNSEKIKQKALQEAYDKKLETTLMKIGVLEDKLVKIKITEF